METPTPHRRFLTWCRRASTLLSLISLLFGTAVAPAEGQVPKLAYAASLGGYGFDSIRGVAVDSSGFVYVTGETALASFAGCPAVASSKGRDLFVAKLTPGGTSVVYCVTLGGSGNEAGISIVSDGLGNAYVAGSTNSSDFPMTPNAYRSTGAGQGDAFVLKLSPAGIVLFTALLGGSGIDAPSGIGLDAAGAIYVGGATNSLDFPATPGVLQPSAHGSMDGFVAKLAPTGSQLAYATFLGGNAMDGVNAIQVAADGSVWAAGYTESPDFPGGVQKRLRDGFAVKLNGSGSALGTALSVAGMGEDSVTALWLDPNGLLVAAGATSSVDFPATPGSAQAVKRAGRDGFVCQWSLPAGTLRFCTLIGGAGADGASAVGQTPNGSIWVAGTTTSLDFPLVSPIQATAGSTQDAWAATLSANGSAWLFSTYLRGAGDDSAAAMALLGNRVWIGGLTLSADFPSTGDGPQLTPGRNGDGWLLRLTTATGPEFVAISPNNGAGIAQKFTVEASHPEGVAKLNNFSLNFSNPLSWASTCHVTTYAGSGNVSLLADNGIGFVATGTAGSAVLLGNSQCSVDLAKSAFQKRGKTVVLTLFLTFRASYASVGASATKLVHSYALDRDGIATGWQSIGNWKLPVTNSPPTLALLAPSSGRGMNQRFRFVLRDENGAADLRHLSVVIGSTLHWDRACFFTYWAVNNIVGLANDDATGYLGLFPPAIPATASNSQCSIKSASSAVAVNGNEIQLDLDFSFLPGFAAIDSSPNKLVFAYVSDGAGAVQTWHQAGSWTVAPTSNPPTLAPLNVNASGLDAVLSVRANTAGGYSDISFLTMNVSAPHQLQSSCTVTYIASTQRLALLNDAGTGYAGDIAPGGSQDISNGQCTLRGLSSTVWGAAGDLYVRLGLTLTAAFSSTGGPVKGVYATAANREWAQIPWTRVGTWVTPSPPSPPRFVSVSPDTGTGAMALFDLRLRDDNGSQDLRNVSLVISDPLSWANSCFLTIFTDSGVLGLANDTAGSYIAFVLPGTMSSLTNSQCELRADLSQVQRDDYEVRITVGIRFNSSYATLGNGRTKRLFSYGLDRGGLNTGWRSFGSWTIQ